MPSKAVIIPIIFLVLIIGAGISETFQGEGYFESKAMKRIEARKVAGQQFLEAWC